MAPMTMNTKESQLLHSGNWWRVVGLSSAVSSRVRESGSTLHASFSFQGKLRPRFTQLLRLPEYDIDRSFCMIRWVLVLS